MKTRWVRRRRHARGIALAEALVSLTVAAMTLALLTSATWGLRQTTAEPEVLQEAATDWLTARRALQSWAASATITSRGQIEGRFFGDPLSMRLILDDGTSRDSRPMMVGLRVVEEDDLFRLTASRHFDIRDIRMATETARESTVIVSDDPLRLIYLVRPVNAGAAPVWTYEPRPEQGLPLAISVERAAERMIVARMPVTVSGFCISRRGELGLEEVECNVR
ncbi:hypothetical protein SLH49_14165 [Cognatiyoonia sp. IB215446]|uniref:hypothetical protein n=1 Tax=Cognatiyoonia sp. IB215446 TaxID=3097355 RepID=UPI002A0EE49B|nr:hypothetical protein [Cognatiyoonia sp. IB215446]MDX8349126.1 hypothetical protein [Cognatiyoonia sp. IB215446]